MRVLVDTSVWVDFFKGHRSPQVKALARLIREEADLVTWRTDRFRLSRKVAILGRENRTETAPNAPMFHGSTRMFQENSVANALN